MILNWFLNHPRSKSFNFPYPRNEIPSWYHPFHFSQEWREKKSTRNNWLVERTKINSILSTTTLLESTSTRGWKTVLYIAIVDEIVSLSIDSSAIFLPKSRNKAFPRLGSHAPLWRVRPPVVTRERVPWTRGREQTSTFSWRPGRESKASGEDFYRSGTTGSCVNTYFFCFPSDPHQISCRRKVPAV